MTLNAEQRKKIYAALAAIGGVLIVYGLVQPDEVEAWLQVVNSVLLLGGSILARKNVSGE